MSGIERRWAAVRGWMVLLAGLGIGLATGQVGAEPAPQAAAAGAGAAEAGTTTPVPLAAADRTALDDYVAAPDGSFGWELVKQGSSPQGKHWQLKLTSQTWQGIVWRHDVTVFEPAELRVSDRLLIYLTSKLNPPENLLGPLLAQKAGARVAILWDIPNQPLFGELREDDLIAHTYVQYLETKDPTWPLLFPMTKSVVRAMDALTALGEQAGWSPNVRQFLVTGGSKRGWTSWLTAAVDRRVFAVAPIVIEAKMREQMTHQLDVLGTNTYKLAPYASRGLSDPAKFDTPEGRRLWTWVDPWMYRHRLTMPHLFIKATNDPWWLVDSLNQYWDDVEAPKHVLYFPNEVHELPDHRPQAAAAVAAFFRTTVAGAGLPRLDWQHDDDGDQCRLSIAAAETPAVVKLWTATSASRDFRESNWQSQVITLEGDRFVGRVPKPATGHVALFGELEFYLDDLKYSLSTRIRVE